MRVSYGQIGLLLAAVLGSRASAPADEILLLNGGKIAGVKVTDLNGSDLHYEYRGRTRVKAIGDIQHVHLDGLPALEEAEASFQAGRYDQAAEAFSKARKSAPAQWQRQWIDLRLIPTLDRAGRFTPAVDLYLSVVGSFPFEAGRLRPRNIPPLPADRAEKLVARTNELRDRLASALAKDALQALTLAIQQARQGPADPPARNSADPAGSEPGSGVATLLTKVGIALDDNRHTEAAALLDLALDRAGPESLALAYFLKGRLTYEQAKDDRDFLRAGWWFARVLAHYRNSERIGPSLYYLANIQKRMGRHGRALALLRESRDAPNLPPKMRTVIDKTLAEWQTSK